MRAPSGFAVLLLFALSALATAPASAREPVGLHHALEQLTRDQKFSGAVVVRGPDGVHFARGYGWADPFERRLFTPETPADSGSLAKPVTSAAALLLVREGKIEIDAPVQRYLPQYPHSAATVRHLLSHSAGLPFSDTQAALANKSNSELLATVGRPLFAPGTTFDYCNLCSITLALLVERVAGMHYLDFVKERLAVPARVALRPQRLADWPSRAIGYRHSDKGEVERFDSWEGERFYGSANFSISASQLAEWGSEWWQSSLGPIRQLATTPARIGGAQSGLTLGNWYCAPDGRRCHYPGHHQGFHHMLYWDAARRISIAMLSNNTLSPALQQRFQRALVWFAQGDTEQAVRELRNPLPETEAPLGRFKLESGETVESLARGNRRFLRRRGIDYPAYPIGSGIRYVPGLDLYFAGAPNGRLRLLGLYEDVDGVAMSGRNEGGDQRATSASHPKRTSGWGPRPPSVRSPSAP